MEKLSQGPKVMKLSGKAGFKPYSFSIPKCLFLLHTACHQQRNSVEPESDHDTEGSTMLVCFIHSFIHLFIQHIFPEKYHVPDFVGVKKIVFD